MVNTKYNENMDMPERYSDSLDFLGIMFGSNNYKKPKKANKKLKSTGASYGKTVEYTQTDINKPTNKPISSESALRNIRSPLSKMGIIIFIVALVVMTTILTFLLYYINKDNNDDSQEGGSTKQYEVVIQPNATSIIDIVQQFNIIQLL